MHFIDGDLALFCRGCVMPLRFDDSDEMEEITRADVSNDNGHSWHKLIVIKLPAAVGGFAFLVPQLAAEGSGFATPEQAFATGTKLILGIVLVLIALFA